MATDTRPSWSLLTNHGAVLLYVATHPEATIRQIAADLELTERRVSAIILDLRTDRLIDVTRCGRRNVYALTDGTSFRQPFIKHVPVRAFVKLIADALPMVFGIGLWAAYETSSAM